MEPARRAAHRLVEAGEVEITQGGSPVEASKARPDPHPSRPLRSVPLVWHPGRVPSGAPGLRLREADGSRTRRKSRIRAENQERDVLDQGGRFAVDRVS
ncbi:DUF3253 domain-containing protein [Streptomyces sp. NPDC005786]